MDLEALMFRMLETYLSGNIPIRPFSWRSQWELSCFFTAQMMCSRLLFYKGPVTQGQRQIYYIYDIYISRYVVFFLVFGFRHNTPHTPSYMYTLHIIYNARYTNEIYDIYILHVVYNYKIFQKTIVCFYFKLFKKKKMKKKTGESDHQ